MKMPGSISRPGLRRMNPNTVGKRSREERTVESRNGGKNGWPGLAVPVLSFFKCAEAPCRRISFVLKICFVKYCARCG
jgi:hypothetical protein